MRGQRASRDLQESAHVRTSSTSRVSNLQASISNKGDRGDGSIGSTYRSRSEPRTIQLEANAAPQDMGRLKVCAHQGCPELTEHRYCPAHSRQVDLRRGSRQSRGYGRQWELSSQAFLREFPLCGMRPNGQRPVMSRCFDNGWITVAFQTDHVVPHKGDQRLFWDRDGNWQALCQSCGAIKSGAGF